MLTMAKVEASIGLPATAWAGRCHEIAGRLLGAGLCPEGKLCYGLWEGPIAEGTIFASRAVTHHGWIEMPDGSVVDPTRWVFEGVDPYIYEGPEDHYDFGGNHLRETWRGPPPSPAAPFVCLRMEGVAAASVQTLLQTPIFRLGRGQIFWLANAPPEQLGESIESIYQAIDEAGYVAFIPIDNRRRILAEAQEPTHA